MRNALQGGKGVYTRHHTASTTARKVHYGGALVGAGGSMALAMELNSAADL